LLTYNLKAFIELRTFFNLTDVFYENNDINRGYNMIPAGLRMFIDEKEWNEKLTELKGNTSGLQSFRKRFFGW